MLATEKFTLTVGEQIFTDHYSTEACDHHRGPAVSWLAEHNLPGRAMTAFQYWCERNEADDFVTRILTREPIRPFQVPWSSREEFVSRVHEIMEVYPELKEWEFAQP
jgi:hypothetical protein